MRQDNRTKLILNFKGSQCLVREETLQYWGSINAATLYRVVAAACTGEILMRQWQQQRRCDALLMLRNTAGLLVRQQQQSYRAAAWTWVRSSCRPTTCRGIRRAASVSFFFFDRLFVFGNRHTMDRTANLGGEKSWRGTAPHLKHSSPNRVNTKKLQQQRHLIHSHLPPLPPTEAASFFSSHLFLKHLENLSLISRIFPHLEKSSPIFFSSLEKSLHIDDNTFL